MKSHLSAILWSRRSTAKCSLDVLASGAVKFAVRKPSPPEKSLGSGIVAQVAAIAGLTLTPSPAAPEEPQGKRGSSPLQGIVWPVFGSPANAPGSTVGTAFKL